jgi:hypothetical protein
MNDGFALKRALCLASLEGTLTINLSRDSQQQIKSTQACQRAPAEGVPGQAAGKADSFHDSSLNSIIRELSNHSAF